MHKNSLSEQLSVSHLNITLFRSAKRRTLSIEIDQSEVRVRAPKRMSKSTIIQFIESKQNWIAKQIAKQPEPLADYTLIDNSQVPLNGREVRIKIIHGRGPISLSHSNEIPILSIPILTSHLSQTESVKRKLVRWYRAQAQTQLEELVHQHAASMQPNLIPPELKVRNYRRRWGSCDYQGRLSFNWRLIMAPLGVQNYVVVHELAHREEFNHSKKFWEIVAKSDPTWRTHQHWLKTYGQRLYRI